MNTFYTCYTWDNEKKCYIIDKETMGCTLEILVTKKWGNAQTFLGNMAGRNKTPTWYSSGIVLAGETSLPNSISP